ncbi:MAG: hypothetical protein K8R88_11115 [Armatimonadetes bacterium]|nr:hypothetical protein [Armatimonadota bacterium]
MEDQARTFQEGDASPELKAELAKFDEQSLKVGRKGLDVAIFLDWAIVVSLSVLAIVMVIVGSIWSLVRRRKKLPGTSSTDRPRRLK